MNACDIIVHMVALQTPAAWCDDTRSEVVGQLGGCRDALDHVLSAPTPSGKRVLISSKHACIIGSACIGKSLLLLSQVHLCFLKWDAFLRAAKNH
jgi:hypothetical protein